MLFVVTVMFFTHLRAEALSFFGLSVCGRKRTCPRRRLNVARLFYMRHVVSCCECFFLTGLMQSTSFHWPLSVSNLNKLFKCKRQSLYDVFTSVYCPAVCVCGHRHRSRAHWVTRHKAWCVSVVLFLLLLCTCFVSWDILCKSGVARFVQHLKNTIGWNIPDKDNDFEQLSRLAP